MLPEDNPFRTPSDLPFRLPPFEHIRTEHIRPAVEAGMAEQLEEIVAITASVESPTFANTIEPLESSGQLLERTLLVFDNLCLSLSDRDVLALRAALAPLRAAHRDAVNLDPLLYARVRSVYADRATLGSQTRTRLLDRIHTDCVRAGAGLSDDAQAQLRAVNSELSSLHARFAESALAELKDLAVHVTDERELAGLPADTVSAAKEAAHARDLDGHLITLVSPTRQPVLAVATDRGVRERIHRASVSRGSRGNADDTRALVTQIATLRATRAALLGYPDHASYVIEDQTAGSAQTVRGLLKRVAGPAATNARAEADELEREMHDDGVPGPLQPWDWAFYAHRVKRRTFDLDESALRPYFEVQRVLHDGLFFAARRLYGVQFTRRDDLTGYHPDTQIFEVTDDAGVALGLFIADWFTRDSKSGGAWMSHFVRQASIPRRRPVVVVNLNVTKPPLGEPALLTTDEVGTAFHEFGHALHGLFSDVDYARLSGTAVPRDFVEFPSQVNEMWAWWPEVLANYAVHHRTGERLPKEQVDRLLAARSYGEGFRTAEYLGAALLDQAWHGRPSDALPVAIEDVEEFERATLAEYGLDLPAVPPRYRSAYLSHSFAGGYDAGYYAYLWSEVLDADLVEWFTESGGLRRENGDRFREHLLSRGNSVDPLEAFAAVRGRAPRIEPLLIRRGLG